MKSFLRKLFLQPKPAPVQPTEETAAPSVAAAAALQGDIAAIALENIFQLFDFAAMSGKMEVWSTANNASFFFNNGVLTYGLLQINHRKIGEMLLDLGMITAEQLEECLLLHEQTMPQPRFGQILLDKGYIQPDLLDNALQCQVKEAFFEVLSWKEGTFVFYQNQYPSPQEVQLYARIDHLLLEGTVLLDDAASLEP